MQDILGMEQDLLSKKEEYELRYSNKRLKVEPMLGLTVVMKMFCFILDYQN